MQHLAIVRVLERQANLHKPVEHHILAELGVRRRLCLDALREVAAVGEIHHDAQPALVDEVLAHADDIGVPPKLL